MYLTTMGTARPSTWRASVPTVRRARLDDWFNLSPVGMVLFDDSGLLVRTNRAFDAPRRRRAGAAVWRS